MASQNFLKKRKSLWIQGQFRDKEQLIRVAKSQAAGLGMTGKIVVIDIGDYKTDLNGQSVTLESGCEYTTSGGRPKAKIG